MINQVLWWRRFAFLVFFTATITISYSQQLKVRAGFASDSTRVGDEVLFYVTARYSESVQVVFPDSTYAFTPFELKRKDYFPTQTRDSISYDSAVYFLRTFEIQAIQSLRLPVFIINPLDCTRVFSNRDTIALRNLVKNMPDSLIGSLPLKATTAYQDVPMETNTPLIAIVFSFLIVIAGAGWVIFGPAIQRYYQVRRMKKQHEAFSATYDQYVTSVQMKFSPATTEAAVVAWRNYMEQITRQPYTKLTSKETTQLEKDDLLGKNLKMVDRAIYGSSDTQVIDSLLSLKSFADQRFNHIIAEVKNG